MGSCQHLRKLVGRQLAIIQHGVLEVREIGQQAQQLLWIGLTELVGSHHVAISVMRAIGGIVQQIAEIGALVLFAIITVLENQSDKLVVRRLVGLGMVQQLLQQLQCLRHLRLETRQ